MGILDSGVAFKLLLEFDDFSVVLDATELAVLDPDPCRDLDRSLRAEVLVCVTVGGPVFLGDLG